MSNYYDWDKFKNIYLEDSYVLGIDETSNKLIFDVEIVLHEEHPLYTTPKPDEQYCYKKGKIIFDELNSVDWINKNNKAYTDAEGDEDLGNIDVFEQTKNGYHLEGDWGEVDVESKPPILEWS